jgi:hypothetical protein
VVEIMAATSDAVAESRDHEGSSSVDLVEGGTVNVLDGLQAILGQVKAAEAGTMDLRAIDELCFQIRFHAQLGAMASPSVA